MVQIAVTIRPGLLPHLKALRHAGMNMARLNGSHGTVEWHRNATRQLRSEIPDVLILMDLPGRKLRLDIPDFMPVKAGDVLSLPLPSYIPEGTEVLFDDGKLRGETLHACHPREGEDPLYHPKVDTLFQGDDRQTITFHNDGTLRPKVGINIPSIPLQGPLLTDRDREFITLAESEKVDFLGLSFIESAELIHKVRALCSVKCIAKIETALAMENLDDICRCTDGVMVARGDLSVECGLFNIIRNQKLILSKALSYGILPMVGTGFLTLYPPQQSTIADVHNAVLDGAVCLVTSGDVIDGEEGVAMVRVLREILNTTNK